MLPKRKGKPPRLERVFQKYDPTLYLLTFNTHLRRHFLASAAVHDKFVLYCQRASQHDIGVGRYVIMPDHIHLFACFGIGSTLTLGEWIASKFSCADDSARYNTWTGIGASGSLAVVVTSGCRQRTLVFQI